MKETIGWIGVGSMGHRMSRHLTTAGYPLVVADAVISPSGCGNIYMNAILLSIVEMPALVYVADVNLNFAGKRVPLGWCVLDAWHGDSLCKSPFCLDHHGEAAALRSVDIPARYLRKSSISTSALPNATMPSLLAAGRRRPRFETGLGC